MCVDLEGSTREGDFNSFGPDLAFFMIEISRVFKKRTLPSGNHQRPLNNFFDESKEHIRHRRARKIPQIVFT